MKYRRLNQEELAELQTEFVQFLVSNTVTADDWVKIKENDTEKAESLIEMFSDIVFQQILEKTEYLEYKEQQDLKTFHCQKEKIIMMGMFIEGNTDVDFRVNMSPDDMMSKVKASNAEVKIYTAEKGYNGGREAELFRMMQGGCLISKDGHLYKTLTSLKGN